MMFGLAPGGCQDELKKNPAVQRRFERIGQDDLAPQPPSPPKGERGSRPRSQLPSSRSVKTVDKLGGTTAEICLPALLQNQKIVINDERETAYYMANYGSKPNTAEVQ
eukprot:gene1930-1985_t